AASAACAMSRRGVIMRLGSVALARVSFVALLLSGSSIAFADVSPEVKEAMTRCDDTSNTYTLQAQLAGCDSAINSGALTTANLAIEHFNKGIVQTQLGDKQGAILSYTQAVQANPA